MNLEKEIKINKILLILLITLSVGTIAIRSSYAMFSKKETFNNVLRIITGSELPSKAVDDLIEKAGQDGLQGLDPMTGTLCSNNCKEYRYTGIYVKNYVQLNNNGQDELWRIIGVFTDEDTNEKYMRIVRNEVLPESYLSSNYVVNGKTYEIKGSEVKAFWNRQTGTKSDNNNWSTAGLQYYLNGEQDSSGNKGYMSYLSAETKKMLRETKHYLGTYSYNVDTTIASYKHERDVKSCVGGKGATTTFPTTGCNVWNGNDATWPGKISLMYPSDVGFAANSNYWSGTQLYMYDLSAAATSWITQTMPDAKTYIPWLLSPTYSGSNGVSALSTSGGVGETISYLYIGISSVKPVLNLKSSVKIKEGTDGSKTNPYIFEN